MCATSTETLPVDVGRAPEIELECSDADIMNRSVSDPRAFELIYGRYASVLHRYVARRMGSAVADDVTSEVFLIAFRGRQSFDLEADSALPWLYGIATNVIRRHWRTERNHHRTIERTGIDPVVAYDHADAVVSQVNASALHKRLSGALGRLSRKEYEVLVLVTWEELTYDGVAQALDIPVGTVRSRLNRARRRLRDILQTSDEN
ncbi:MAG: RNA polymerase sigma factor [Longispora sp.]|nr:RNA polymerase sigma factor [Longispora sp. (in: high G+C Gram-positive bacteria)]